MTPAAPTDATIRRPSDANTGRGGAACRSEQPLIGSNVRRTVAKSRRMEAALSVHPVGLAGRSSRTTRRSTATLVVAAGPMGDRPLARDELGAPT